MEKELLNLKELLESWINVIVCMNQSDWERNKETILEKIKIVEQINKLNENGKEKPKCNLGMDLHVPHCCCKEKIEWELVKNANFCKKRWKN